MNKHTKHKGLATIVGLAVLAVIAASAVIFIQSMTAERQFDAAAFRIQQAEQLADDLFRITENQKKDISLTIPASHFHGIADLQLTVTVKDNSVTAVAAYSGTELPETSQYRAERKN